MIYFFANVVVVLSGTSMLKNVSETLPCAQR